MKATKDFFEEFRKELRRRTLGEDLEDASLAEEINENTGNKPTWEELFRDNKRYRKENGRLKKTIEELRKQVGEIDAMSEWTDEDREQMRKWEEEMSQREAALEKVGELMEEIQFLRSRLKKRDKGEERLPITTFIQYVEEHFTPEQNDRAKIIKEVLYDVFSSANLPQEVRERLKKLGFKPKSSSSVTINGPLNDIHDNEHVRAGM